MNNALPAAIPECAVRMLARPEWFRDRGIVARARLKPAAGLASLLSGAPLAKIPISAITLGRTIHFRDLKWYDPHTPGGLALLAHELKHVEQYERGSPLGFYANYVRDYFAKGYGPKINVEGEAYHFQEVVQAHLENEFRHNQEQHPCLEKQAPHSTNQAYQLMVPAPFRPPV
jgi:hypothetical protein